MLVRLVACKLVTSQGERELSSFSWSLSFGARPASFNVSFADRPFAKIPRIAKVLVEFEVDGERHKWVFKDLKPVSQEDDGTTVRMTLLDPRWKLTEYIPGWFEFNFLIPTRPGMNETRYVQRTLKDGEPWTVRDVVEELGITKRFKVKFGRGCDRKPVNLAFKGRNASDCLEALLHNTGLTCVWAPNKLWIGERGKSYGTIPDKFVLRRTSSERLIAPEKLYLVGGPAFNQLIVWTPPPEELSFNTDILKAVAAYQEYDENVHTLASSDIRTTLILESKDRVVKRGLKALERARNWWQENGDYYLEPVMRDLTGQWRNLFELLYDWETDFIGLMRLVRGGYSVDQFKGVCSAISEKERQEIERLRLLGLNVDYREAQARRLASEAFRCFRIPKKYRMRFSVDDAKDWFLAAGDKPKDSFEVQFQAYRDEILPIRTQLHDPYIDYNSESEAKEKERTKDIPIRPKIRAFGYFSHKRLSSIGMDTSREWKASEEDFEVLEKDGVIKFKDPPWMTTGGQSISEVAYMFCPYVCVEFSYETKHPALGLFNRFVIEIKPPSDFNQRVSNALRRGKAFVSEESVRLYYRSEGDPAFTANPDYLCEPIELNAMKEFFDKEDVRKRYWDRYPIQRQAGRLELAIWLLPEDPLAIDSASFSISSSGLSCSWEIGTGRSADVPEAIISSVKRRLTNLEVEVMSGLSTVPWGNPLRQGGPTLEDRSEIESFGLTKSSPVFGSFVPIEERLRIINAHHYGPIIIYDPEEEEDVIAAEGVQTDSSLHLHYINNSRYGPILCRNPGNIVSGDVVVAGAMWWSQSGPSWNPNLTHKIGGFWHPWVKIPASITEGGLREYLGRVDESDVTFPTPTSISTGGNDLDVFELPYSTTKTGLRLEVQVRQALSTSPKIAVEYFMPLDTGESAVAKLTISTTLIEQGVSPSSSTTSSTTISLSETDKPSILIFDCPVSNISDNSFLIIDFVRDVSVNGDTYSDSLYIINVKFLWFSEE